MPPAVHGGVADTNRLMGNHLRNTLDHASITPTPAVGIGVWQHCLHAMHDASRRARSCTPIQSSSASVVDTRGWGILHATLGPLEGAKLGRTVAIRGAIHVIAQPLLRRASHAELHVGQILYVARLLRPGAPWLTIAPDGSRDASGGYRNRSTSEAS